MFKYLKITINQKKKKLFLLVIDINMHMKILLSINPIIQNKYHIILYIYIFFFTNAFNYCLIV